MGRNINTPLTNQNQLITINIGGIQLCIIEGDLLLFGI